MQPNPVTPYDLTINIASHSNDALETPSTNSLVYFKTYIKDAFTTGYEAGKRNSGAFFAGIVSGRKKQFHLLENQLARDIGYVASIIATLSIVYLFDKENAPTLITTFMFTTALLENFNNTSNAVLAASFFTENTSLPLKLITFSAYVINIAKLIDSNMGEKFGELPGVKKIFGTSCGTLNAICSTHVTIFMRKRENTKKITDISIAYMK